MTLKDAIDQLRQKMLDAGTPEKINPGIEKLKALFASKKIDDPDTAYLVGADRDGYLHDMKIAQRWATQNRQAIADSLVAALNLEVLDQFETIHNYLGEDNIIRKSAISAKKGEPSLIPMNMRDGSLLCVGLGNEDWNCSAPHGAGRLMSRAKAKASISLDSFKQSMDGIFTTSVSAATVDEAPAAYKPADKIKAAIVETVEIRAHLHPIYNFKASE